MTIVREEERGRVGSLAAKFKQMQDEAIERFGKGMEPDRAKLVGTLAAAAAWCGAGMPMDVQLEIAIPNPEEDGAPVDPGSFLRDLMR